MKPITNNRKIICLKIILSTLDYIFFNFEECRKLKIKKCEKICSENRPILVIYAVNPSKALKGGL